MAFAIALTDDSAIAAATSGTVDIGDVDFVRMMIRITS